MVINMNPNKIDIIHWNRLCFTAPCPCWFTPDKILPRSSQFMAPDPIELSCRKFKISNIAATDKYKPAKVTHCNVQFSKVYGCCTLCHIITQILPFITTLDIDSSFPTNLSLHPPLSTIPYLASFIRDLERRGAFKNFLTLMFHLVR